MFFLVLYIFASILALAAGGFAAYSDFKGMIIPNRISLALLGLLLLCMAACYIAGVGMVAPFMSHVLAGIIMFIVTFIMFSMKMLGGGDAKIMSAYAFWLGVQGMFVFLFYTTLFGAMLGAVALYLKKKKPVKAPAEGSWIARVQAGESAVPYGIAIFLGAVIAFLTTGYFTIERLSAFLV